MRHLARAIAASVPLLVALVFVMHGSRAYGQDRHWKGAGTGGVTATDASDPRTWWSRNVNWQEGAPPGSTGQVYLPLANAGYVNAAGATVWRVLVDGPSEAGALCIGPGADLHVTDSVLVGDTLQGRIVQTGGTHTVGGDLSLGSSAGSTGAYTLSEGALAVLADEYVGKAGTGTFTQSEGTHTVSDTLAIGPGSAYHFSGGTLSVPRLSVRSGGLFQASGGTFDAALSVLAVDEGGQFRVEAGTLAARNLELRGRLTVAGGTLNADSVTLVGGAGGSIEGAGTVVAPLAGDAFSRITVSGGDLALGRADSWNGFSTAGSVEVGGNVLTLNSLSFVTLGSVTTVNGGTLRAPNGIFMPGGSNLVASGQVQAALASSNGSTIVAAGDLQLGDAATFDGVNLDGRLRVEANTVTLRDANEAVLGPLTTIGGGTLAAPNGALLGQGRNLVGHGLVTGDFANQGYVLGEGPDAGDLLEFTGHVSGIGRFDGTIMFSGTFSPGNSPAAVALRNVVFGESSTLEMELGGREAGAGYDQLDIAGGARLDGTLNVVLIYGFLPRQGDEFDVFGFADREGAFDAVRLPALPSGLAWDASDLYTAGTLRVVPEPATLALLAVGGLSLLWRRKSVRPISRKLRAPAARDCHLWHSRPRLCFSAHSHARGRACHSSEIVRKLPAPAARDCRLHVLACLVVPLCFACGLSAAEEKQPMPEKGPTFGPPDPAEWQPLAALSDEFDGTALDAAKWHPTNPEWAGRQPGWFSPKNVTVSDGKLHITMKKETLPGMPKGFTYTCGAVKSKTPVLYGFFEVKARAMNSRGSSAFWFYNSTPAWWTEIDVVEIGAGAPKHRRAVHMNVHVFVTPEDGKKHWDKSSTWEAPFDLAAGYHVYALEWDEKKLVWYVDGVARRTSENTHWRQPLFMNFDSETMPDWFGLPDEKDLPSTFSIEYVRSWQRKSAP